MTRTLQTILALLALVQTRACGAMIGQRFNKAVGLPIHAGLEYHTLTVAVRSQRTAYRYPKPIS